MRSSSCMSFMSTIISTLRASSFKGFLRYTLSTLMLAGCGYWLGFRQGQIKGYGEATAFAKQHGFVRVFSILQLIRDGEMTKGLRSLETHCYSLASDLYGMTDSTSRMISGLYLEDIKKYRARYADAPSERSVTEKELDKLLQMQ